MKRYCLAVDLADDPQLISEYEQWHAKGKVWPEITQSIIDAGIVSMEIYRAGNRLCMMMETLDNFSFDQKAAMDAGNEKVQLWEKMMWKYQRSLPVAKPGEKWVLMDKIFDLKA